MKKCILVIVAIICSFLCANILYAADDSWTQKADFGGIDLRATIGCSNG
jgi:hypothetical protein